MSTTELPDIPGIVAEPTDRHSSTRTHRSGTTKSFVLLSALLAFVFSVMLTIVCVLLGKDQLLAYFGAPTTKKPTPIELAIEELKSNQILIAQELDTFQKNLDAVSARQNDSSLALDKGLARVEAVAGLVSSLESKVERNEKAQAARAAEVKKQANVAAAKPKPAPIIPLSIISIRIQAGTPLVALRDGLDNSELLMPGDTWRGWTLLDADPSNKTARFTVAGAFKELRLQ